MNSVNGDVSYTKITFPKSSITSDPQTEPILIVGRRSHLTTLSYDNIKHKLEPRVNQDTFEKGIASLSKISTDTVSLYLNLAVVSSTQDKCSRHNIPSRPHSVAGVVKSFKHGTNETILAVCEFVDVIPITTAIARSYPIYTKKTSKKKSSTASEVKVEFILVDGLQDKIDLEVLESIAESVRLSARLVDTPCSEMNVLHFTNEIRAVADSHDNLTIKVIRGEELKKENLNGIYSVGKSAPEPPALVVLEYNPPDQCLDETIAWVGKGIVYDTGGLSLKTRAMMQGMKRDCGGAAGILGAMSVAAKLGMSTRVVAIFCLAENGIGPDALKPDDIETLYSGRTVEINNTDAEGRLVLADGVVYAAKNYNPKFILDMATLTGAQGITTGKYHAALLTNSGLWEEKCVSMAKLSGDLIFPIVFAPELHFSEYDSSLADMKNSVADRSNAQSSCAGLFILAHLGFDFPNVWIHVDMAFPVCTGERATGYGVALLTVLFSEYSKNTMLKSLSLSYNK